jgi:hypothetical protein
MPSKVTGVIARHSANPATLPISLILGSRMASGSRVHSIAASAAMTGAAVHIGAPCAVAIWLAAHAVAEMTTTSAPIAAVFR